MRYGCSLKGSLFFLFSFFKRKAGDGKIDNVRVPRSRNMIFTRYDTQSHLSDYAIFPYLLFITCVTICTCVEHHYTTL